MPVYMDCVQNCFCSSQPLIFSLYLVCLWRYSAVLLYYLCPPNEFMYPDWFVSLVVLGKVDELKILCKI